MGAAFLVSLAFLPGPGQPSQADGRTPLMWASQEGLAAPFDAVTRGNTDRVRSLLSEGVDVNRPGPDGRTVLMAAACLGDRAMVGLLLQSGADARARGTEGESAADIARAGGHGDIVALLEEAVRVPLSPR